MTPFEYGYTTALRTYGMTKQAAGWGLLGRAGTAIRNRMPSWGSVGEFVYGSPRKFMGELRQGKAFSKGSLIRDSLKAEGPIAKTLFYGMPAVQGVNIMTDSGGNKTERLGDLAGQTIGGLAAWKPFGMVGSMVAGAGLGALGGYAGRSAANLVSGPAPAQPPAAFPGYPHITPAYTQTY